MRVTRLVAMVWVAGLSKLAAQVPDELQHRATQAFAGQQWAQAAEAYGAIVARTPDAPVPHFRLGIALINLKRHEEARGHLVTAERLGMAPAQVALRLAQVEAAAGRNDAAFAQLQRATDAGLSFTPVPPDQDPDLARLKTDDRWKAFLAAIDRNTRPCLYDPKYSEFDFWLGDWEVRPRGAPNAPASRNVITKVHDGCVVLESYSTPLGYTGQSFNIFDRTRNQWNQTWVDRSGGLHVYWGEARDGNMYYEGEMPDPQSPGKRVRTRLTFFRIAADTVRQFSESSRDDGKTWTANYDLLYTRKR